MKTLSAPTFTAQIFMAGDIAQAKQVIRAHVAGVGLCVTIEPVDYIYTGGEEAGFRIGLINYPRFPSDPKTILARAMALAEQLREALNQHSFSVVTPVETVWRSWREQA